MRSTPNIKSARPTGDFTVYVEFDDGVSGEVDLSYLLDGGPVFRPLRDPAFFRKVRADRELGTICWPNDADIAPETLYEHAKRSAAVR